MVCTIENPYIVALNFVHVIGGLKNPLYQDSWKESSCTCLHMACSIENPYNVTLNFVIIVYLGEFRKIP